MNEIPWTLKDLKKALFWTFLLVVIINVFLLWIDFGRIFEASPHKSLFSLLLFLIQEIIFIAPLVFFIFKKYKIKKGDLGFLNIGIFKIIGYAFLGYFYVIFLGILFTLMTAGKVSEVPGFDIQQSYFGFFNQMQTPLDISIAVFILIILAPVVEEVVFRGCILQTLIKYFGISRGNIFTAFFFAFIHFQFQSFFILFILGLILNWLFLKSKSIYPTIGFHILNNSIAFAVQFLIWRGDIVLSP